MSGTELDDMTLEQFKFWKVPALKDVLRKGICHVWGFVTLVNSFLGIYNVLLIL